MKKLSIILLEDMPFNELLIKMEKLFSTSFSYKNQDGRLIAKGKINEYSISVIDRYDDLDDSLCDETHILDFMIEYKESFSYEFHEEKILRILNQKLNWEKSIWSPTEKIGGPYRRVYSNGDIEIFHR
ncbi:hypothetical protein [Tenacibaculum maritimum]|uniref:hypothetical protein n=2 Tax=Tenacibaculum maritimum TaxID=107401 RepID=UPI0010A54378|nr:hypothetical protein [Tenacibaculum maritimum]MCD9583248.1 hypothetical protein [Tenacibaculum maritimum]MCD9585871.1 hypothetical protein [Tenacibaculum maritimum]MCD9612096.1 hypothetical protein [Tenacibaculum maritimum]MCD9622139.1 hypothetical protein [Tenacibaculum maritimum]MCD9628627.1 hypothetical protein [Tenacibaculum maritimum]